MENLKFRVLEEKDLIRVMEIERQSFAKTTWESEEVYKERKNSFPEGNMGIWKNDEMIGFICSELWEKEKEYSENRFTLSHNIVDFHKTDGKELYISSFALDEKYIGKGLGGKSFSKFTDYIMKKYKLESSILLVSKEWKNAIQIYKKYGFNEISIIKGFFENDKKEKFDGLIMKK